MLGREFGLEDLAEALRVSLAAAVPTNAQHVRQIALNAATACRPQVEVTAPFALSLPAPDLACYDALAGCPVNAEMLAAQVKLYASELKMPGLAGALDVVLTGPHSSVHFLC